MLAHEIGHCFHKGEDHDDPKQYAWSEMNAYWLQRELLGGYMPPTGPGTMAVQRYQFHERRNLLASFLLFFQLFIC